MKKRDGVDCMLESCRREVIIWRSNPSLPQEWLERNGQCDLFGLEFEVECCWDVLGYRPNMRPTLLLVGWHSSTANNGEVWKSCFKDLTNRIPSSKLSKNVECIYFVATLPSLTSATNKRGRMKQSNIWTPPCSKSSRVLASMTIIVLSRRGFLGEAFILFPTASNPMK